MSSSPPLEIERVFLLRGMPQLPAEHEVCSLEQGYLPEVPETAAGSSEFLEGRIRRTTRSDGSTRCHHTIKRGGGIVREEIEREIECGEFERLWPRTEGRRISKVRHRVAEGDVIWEVDRFEGLPLVLAEVELKAVDQALQLPRWLEGWVIREVSEDPRYRNSAIALGLGNHGPLPPLR